METTSRQPGTARAASVNAWANEKWVSNVPPGRRVVGVQPAGVGDPFVDQHQARAEPLQLRHAIPDRIHRSPGQHSLELVEGDVVPQDKNVCGVAVLMVETAERRRPSSRARMLRPPEGAAA